MATGASTCDLAIILIDARHGVLDADQAAQLHRVAAGHQARPGRGQQDGPGRLLRRTSSNEIQRDYTGLRGTHGRADDVHFIPISALQGRQRGRPQCEHAVVRGQHADALAGERAYRLGPQPDRLPLSRAVRQPAESRLPRLLRHESRRASSARATRSWCCRRGRRAASSRSSRSTASWRRPLRRRSVTLTLEDEIDVSRGDMIVHPGNVPANRADVRRDDRLDGRRAAGAGQAVPVQAGDQDGRRARCRRCATGSTSTRCIARTRRRCG